MSISKLLWKRHTDFALCSLSHPFVLSLQRGLLNSDAFKKYIAQDAYYLNSFKDAFGMAKALCSRRNDTKGVLHFNDLQTNILHELEMHKELSASLGIDLQKVKPLPATQLYVEFLDHTSASSNSVANICASMVPCMSLYAFIGKRAIENGLCIELDSNRWVKEYSSEGFQSYAVGLETLLDVYAETEGKSIDDLQSFYRSAMELEYAFFNALEFRSWSGLNPATFLVDFDETISLDETIALICQAHKQHEDASSKYELLLLQYLNSYRSFIKEHIPSSDQRNTFDRNVVDDFLSKYTAFETSMLGPVEESGILSNLTQSQLTAIGESVHTRVSVFYVLKHALRRMNRSSSPAFIDVVTLNWSRDVVQASCALHLDDLKHRVRVHSNDLEWDVNTGLSTGLISKVMTGPTHKVGTQRHLTSGCGEGLHVFVGDSLGDLGALLETDIGILVGNKESMQRHCKVFGIELQRLERFVVRMTEEGGATAALKNTNGKTPILYLADSWAHIGFCLFGKPFISEWLADQRQGSTVSGGTGLRMPTVLSVAGSDSGGGAGIQADMKACSACGVFSATAITALTAQNTIGVTAVEAVSPSMLTAQLEAVLSDIAVDVIKSGMLPNEASAQLLTRAAISHAVAHVVVDPVMVTSSGSRLMPPEEAEGIRRALFPLATVITPNIHEACALLGISSIRNLTEMKAAAKQLFDFGPAYVLLKGGHLIEDQQEGQVVDILYDGQDFEYVSGDYVATSNTHGTGCTLASALAAGLAKGLSVSDAVKEAKKYLSTILLRSRGMKIGKGPHGPLNHMSALVPMMGGRRRREDLNKIDLSVYVVTDGAINERHGRTMEEAVEAALAGGATVVQLREKKGSSADLVSLATRLLRLTSAHKVPLIINDRIDVALAVGADGVHLGQGDISAAVARRLIGPDMILGVSAKTVEQAQRAVEDGADYLGVGAVYGTATKTDATNIGLDGFSQVRQSVDLPVVAIGGIGLGERARAAMQAGADGVAVVSAVFDSADVQAATQSLVADVAGSRATLPRGLLQIDINSEKF